MSDIIYFKNTKELRKWFEKNHDKLNEQWFGIYKKGSDKTGVTYMEAVEAALCYGWIDGLIKGINEKSYSQRFTPRRKGSIWSAINIAKVKSLTEKGLMHEAGLKAFNERDIKKQGLYSFEQKEEIKLPAAYLKKIKANKKAWEYYSKRPPGYKRISSWWIISAKQEETRLRRLDALIRDSAAGQKIGLLREKKK